MVRPLSMDLRERAVARIAAGESVPVTCAAISPRPVARLSPFDSSGIVIRAVRSASLGVAAPSMRALAFGPVIPAALTFDSAGICKLALA